MVTPEHRLVVKGSRAKPALPGFRSAARTSQRLLRSLTEAEIAPTELVQEGFRAGGRSRWRVWEHACVLTGSGAREVLGYGLATEFRVESISPDSHPTAAGGP